MDDQTLLIIAAAGIGVYVLYKSGVFQGLSDTVGGVGDAVGGIGQGVGTVGIELGESFKSFADLQQSFINRLSDALNAPGGKSERVTAPSFTYTGPSGIPQLVVGKNIPQMQPTILPAGATDPTTQRILQLVQSREIKLRPLPADWRTSPSPAAPTLTLPSTPTPSMRTVVAGMKSPRAAAPRFSLNNIKARRF